MKIKENTTIKTKIKKESIMAGEIGIIKEINNDIYIVEFSKNNKASFERCEIKKHMPKAEKTIKIIKKMSEEELKILTKTLTKVIKNNSKKAIKTERRNIPKKTLNEISMKKEIIKELEKILQ